MRTFEVIRQKDEGGHSGTGKVIEGVVFSDGTCVVRWCVGGQPNSTAVWESYEAFARFHIDDHPANETIINWFNEDTRD